MGLKLGAGFDLEASEQGLMGLGQGAGAAGDHTTGYDTCVGDIMARPDSAGVLVGGTYHPGIGVISWRDGGGGGGGTCPKFGYPL